MTRLARFFLIACALASVVVASSAATAASSGLCVSSTSNSTLPITCDVVSNGVVQTAWATPTQQFATYTQAQLYAIIDPLEGGTTAQTVQVEYRLVTENAHAAWSSSQETLVLPVAGDGAASVMLNSTLVCDTDGWSNYSVVLSIADQPSVTVFFSKQCVYPLLEVGTFEQDSNVVHDSQAVSTFAAYVYTSNVDATVFRVYLSDVQMDPTMMMQPFYMHLESSQPDELIVYSTGVQGWYGVAFQGAEFAIDVNYTCTGKTQGVVNVQVNGELHFGWSEPITYQFHYRCGAGQALSGLNVGTKVGASDVASNGVLVGDWTSTYIYAADEIYEFPLIIDSSEVDAVEYNITVVVEKDAVYDITVDTLLSGTVSWVDGKPVPIPFFSQIVCSNAGTARTLIQLTFGDYNPVQLQFRYTCALPLFNIGDEPLGNNIMALGVNQNWVGYADADKTSAQFFIMLDATSPVASNMYVLSATSYDDTVLAPTISDPNHGNATTSAKSDDNPVTVQLTCVPCAEATASPLVVTVSFGWVQTAVITVKKDCALSTEQKEECGLISRHHRWTTAGIFFFVLFILGLVSCIAGCAYNRFKAEKSGWAIVPGATTAIRWIDNVRSRGRGQRWSPQDEEDGSFLSTAGHANYSTNL